MVMVLAARTLYTGCDFPLWMQWGIVIYGAVIILLFINFYVHAYIHPSKPKDETKVRNSINIIIRIIIIRQVSKPSSGLSFSADCSRDA